MLELIILSSLLLGPYHGYEIKKLLSGLKINNNTLYPLLKTIQEKGYVEMELQPQENKPPKKVYTLTDLGKDHLFDLVLDFNEEKAGNDDEFYIRVAFFQFLDKEHIEFILDARDEALKLRADQGKVMKVLERFPDNSYDLLFLHNFINSNINNQRQFVSSMRSKYLIK